MTNKTLPLLLAGLLATAGAFAQSAGGSSGDSSMSSQPGSPSQSLNSSGSRTTTPSATTMDSLPGTRGAASPSSSSTMGASPSTVAPATEAPATVAPATGTMGAAPAPDVVIVQPAVAVPVAVPVIVQRDARSERWTGNRAVDTGNGQLESNMGPYDRTWTNPNHSRAGSY